MPTSERVLITGGAGFVGSHLADALAAGGADVVLFDNLEPQVHGEEARPAYLDPRHRLIVGDVRDPIALGEALANVDVVVHLAAMVGVGQSMYQIARYTDVNAMGCANLLQTLVDLRGSHHVRKLVVASSMSIYGEGAYSCPTHGEQAPQLRTPQQLASHDWELHCPECGASLSPLPTPERKPLFPTSIYAINKRDHEEMSLAFGHAYEVPTVALRFFNIFGSRQALSNPYTGVAAIFSGRMLSGERPLIYEDGEQQRDFVHVSDVVQAITLAIHRSEADYTSLNVGSGRAISVREVAEALARELRWEGGFEVTQQFRTGDIRHCYADISRIQQLLGYEPKVTFEDGLGELVGWVGQQQGLAFDSAGAIRQLSERGLVR